MICEIFEKSILIGGVKYYIFKYPNEGQRYTPVKLFKKKYGIGKALIKKPCYHYTKAFNLIKEYSSIKEAAKDLKVCNSSLSYWVQKGISPKGEIWSRKPISKIEVWEYSNKNFSQTG